MSDFGKTERDGNWPFYEFEIEQATFKDVNDRLNLVLTGTVYVDGEVEQQNYELRFGTGYYDFKDSAMKEEWDTRDGSEAENVDGKTVFNARSRVGEFIEDAAAAATRAGVDASSWGAQREAATYLNIPRLEVETVASHNEKTGKTYHNPKVVGIAGKAAL